MPSAPSSFYREALSSLLQDLPGGAHAMVLSGDARPGEILDVVRAEVKDSGEELVLHAPTVKGPRPTDARYIDAFDARVVENELESGPNARAPSPTRYLLAVFADQAAKIGSWEDHVRAETLVGRTVREKTRIVCFYDAESLRELGTVQALRAANCHSVLMPRPEEG